MLTSYLLALREGTEAALVIGIMLGTVRQLRRPDCARIIWIGVVSALGLSVLVAFALRAFGRRLAGPAEPIFEGATLFISAGLLTWMILWMSRQAHVLRIELEAAVRQALCSPGRGGMFVVAFVAVAREGIELALFLTTAALDAKAAGMVIGGVLGLATAVLVGWTLFASAARFDLSRFFRVTGGLLVLFAAGLVAKGIHEFNEIGLIPAGTEPVWNSGRLLSERSAFGAALRTLFGYTSHPSLAAVLGYVAFGGVVVILLLGRTRPTVDSLPLHGTRHSRSL